MKDYKIVSYSKDPDLLERIQQLLENEGVESVGAKTDSQLFLQLEEDKPMMVLLDVLENDEVYESCREIKSEATWQDVIVLFIVDELTVEAVDQLEELGSQGFIRRDFYDDEFLGKVLPYLELDSKVTEIQKLNQLLKETADKINELGHHLEARDRRLEYLRTNLNELEEELKYATIYDNLTQLYNRHFGEQQLSILLERYDRKMIVSSALLLTIDQAEQPTSTLKDKEEMIRRVAKLLYQRKRQGDVMIRWDDTKLMVLLPDTDAKGADFFARRALKNVTKLMVSDGDKKLPLSLSIGGASIDKVISYDIFNRLVKDALTLSQERGGNQVTIVGL